MSVRNKLIVCLYKDTFVTTDRASTFFQEGNLNKPKEVVYNLQASMSLLTQTARNGKESQEMILNQGEGL